MLTRQKIGLKKTTYILTLSIWSFFVFAQGKVDPVGLMAPGAGLGAIANQQEQQKQPTIKTMVEPIKPQSNMINDAVAPGSFDEFLIVEKGCKSGSSTNCLTAGKIMMSEKPPKEIFDMSSTQRANRALRFYESAINAGNLEAMELAYDLYLDPNLIVRETNSYTDKARAKELLDAMLQKGYAGGQIRLARDYIENPEYLLSLGKKKEACMIVKELNSKNDLTESTKGVLNSLNDGIVCKIAG